MTKQNAFDPLKRKVTVLHTDFPLLASVCDGKNNTLLGKIKPKEIEILGKEINEAFERCAVPESGVSPAELIINMTSINTIVKIDSQWASQKDTEAGAMLLMLRRKISTPTNLGFLIEMCDVNVRTGAVRCAALKYLIKLSSMENLYSTKMSDGYRLSTHLIRAMSKAVEDEYRMRHSKKLLHTCSGKCTETHIMELLETGLRLNKSCPLETFKAFSGRDWANILPCSFHQAIQSQDGKDNTTFMGMNLYICMHQVVLSILQKDPQNIEALCFLREKLGSCIPLLHNILRQIGKSYFCFFRKKGTSSEDSQIIVAIAVHVQAFFRAFFNCLISPPSDVQTENLLRDARSRIASKISKNRGKADQCSLQIAIEVKNYLSGKIWMEETRLTDKERWERFCKINHKSNHDYQNTRERFRHQTKTKLRYTLEESTGKNAEMCANCFKLEVNLEDNLKMMQCGRCKSTSYCSRSCQTEHWRKGGHREHCAGSTTTKKKKNRSESCEAEKKENLVVCVPCR